MIVYIDESGDLGWTFDKPYGKGGSSRYLTIAILITPNDKSFLPKKIIRDFYKKYKISPKKEVKGTELSSDQKQYLVQRIIDLLDKNPEIKIVTITTQKANVQDHIRTDSNKLYNYMIRLALLDEIYGEDSVTLMPDPRSIKVKSGNSLLDYLQTELWFEYNSSTNLDQKVVSSENSLNLKFVDIISNLIWRKFEKATTEADLLIPHIKVKRLFFNSQKSV
jgi:hypothetical protein